MNRLELHAAVHAAVDAADPEGLLAMGAPADEYSLEIPDLAALVGAGAVTPVAVLAVWERWFGPGSRLLRSPDRLGRLTDALARIGPTDDRTARTARTGPALGAAPRSAQDSTS